MPKTTNKNCGTCRYARKKPTESCACNNKVKLGGVMVQMKYNDAGHSYCDGYKIQFKG